MSPDNQIADQISTTDHQGEVVQSTIQDNGHPWWSAALAATIFSVGLIYTSHLVVLWVRPDTREEVLLGFALLFVPWPFMTLFAPKWSVISIALYPVFGIWLGLRYCGDMGADGHMFYAIPPFFAGLWGTLLGSMLAWHRIRNVR